MRKMSLNTQDLKQILFPFFFALICWHLKSKKKITADAMSSQMEKSLPLDLISVCATFLEGSDVVMLGTSYKGAYTALAKETKLLFHYKVNLQAYLTDEKARNFLMEKKTGNNYYYTPAV